jgi:hypothetical protein
MSARQRRVFEPRKRMTELERKIGQQQLDLVFFSASLAASRGRTEAERAAAIESCILLCAAPRSGVL